MLPSAIAINGGALIGADIETSPPPTGGGELAATGGAGATIGESVDAISNLAGVSRGIGGANASGGGSCGGTADVITACTGVTTIALQ